MKMIMKKQLCYGFRIILILGNTTPFRDPRTTSFRDTQFCRSGPRFPKFSRSRSGPGLSRTWIPHRSLSGKGPGPVLRPNRLVLDAIKSCMIYCINSFSAIWTRQIISTATRSQASDRFGWSAKCWQIRTSRQINNGWATSVLCSDCTYVTPRTREWNERSRLLFCRKTAIRSSQSCKYK